jgi:hypothetical protein
MNQHCGSNTGASSPYKIGEWWEVHGDPCGDRKPPHIEDFAVTKASKTRLEPDLDTYLRSVIDPWNGSIEKLFDGTIRFTKRGAGYISPEDVPPHATGFWIPDSPLFLEVEDGKASYHSDDGITHLSYVGTQEPIEKIEAGRLVRVSLARWWKPNNAEEWFELRCYAQLSGWY